MKDIIGLGPHYFCRVCRDYTPVEMACHIPGQDKVECPDCYAIRQWYKARRFDWIGWAD